MDANRARPRTRPNSTVNCGTITQQARELSKYTNRRQEKDGTSGSSKKRPSEQTPRRDLAIKRSHAGPPWNIKKWVRRAGVEASNCRQKEDDDAAIRILLVGRSSEPFRSRRCFLRAASEAEKVSLCCFPCDEP